MSSRIQKLLPTSQSKLIPKETIGNILLAGVFVCILIKIYLHTLSNNDKGSDAEKDMNSEKHIGIAISVLLVIVLGISCAVDDSNLIFAVPVTFLIFFRTYIITMSKHVSNVAVYDSFANIIEIVIVLLLLHKRGIKTIKLITLLILSVFNIPIYVITKFYSTDG